jgi:Skp family chaperone for outer membrane proteins
MENRTFIDDNDYSNLIMSSALREKLSENRLSRRDEFKRKKEADKLLAQAEYEQKMAKIKLDQASSQSDIEKATAEYEQAKADSKRAKMEQVKADLEQKDLEEQQRKLEEANKPATAPATESKGMSNNTKLLIGGALLVGAFLYFRKN